MKYKMIACDFDGTIFSHKSFSVPENVRKAIRRYIEAGGKFVITTGRMFDSLINELKILDLHGDVLCMHGAVCYDVDSEKESFDFDISNEDGVRFARAVDEMGWISHLYIGRDLYVEKENPYTEYYKNAYSARPIYVNKKLSDYLIDSGNTLHKAIVMSEPEDVARKIFLLSERCPNLVYTQSMPEYIEVVDPHGGKGNAVARLAASYGIDISEVAAFGDQTNDVSMLKVAGFTAAPSNAVDAVKSIAKVICGNVDEGGLAEVIDAIRENKYE